MLAWMATYRFEIALPHWRYMKLYSRPGGEGLVQPKTLPQQGKKISLGMKFEPVTIHWRVHVKLLGLMTLKWVQHIIEQSFTCRHHNTDGSCMVQLLPKNLALGGSRIHALIVYPLIQSSERSYLQGTGVGTISYFGFFCCICLGPLVHHLVISMWSSES